MKIKRWHNYKLIKSIHSDTFPLDDWYDSEDNLYWIVENDEDQHGFAILTLLEHNIAFLSRAGLMPSARGLGLHKKLIKARVGAAKRLGVEKLITYTKIDNITSARNLQACGFKIYLPEYLYGGEDSVYWMLEF